MKYKKKLSVISNSSKKWIAPLLAALLFVVLLKQIHVFDRLVSLYKTCLPLLMGGVIAFLLQPIIDRIQVRFSNRTSVIFVYLGIFILGLGILLFMTPIIYQQILDFVEAFPTWMKKITALLNQYHISIDSFTKFQDQYLQEGTTLVLDSLKNTMDTITFYGIAYITGFFLSIDMDFWKRTAKKIIPNSHQFSLFYHTMSNIIYQYLVGTLLDLLFIVISVGFVLSISGFPNALLYALILGLLNLFPYIGATIGLVLIAVVAMMSYESFPFVMFLIVWTIQQIESNLIQPMIFNKTMHIRPILTFVFIFIGDAFFGVVGVILSPIFAAIAQIIFRSYLHSKTSDSVGEWEDIWRDFDEVMKEEKEKQQTI